MATSKAHHEPDEGHDARYYKLDLDGTADVADSASELGPDDSPSQIGRVITTNDEIHPSPWPTNDTSWHPVIAPTNVHHVRSLSSVTDGSDLQSASPSRRTSLRSARAMNPTMFVPSKTDRLRYSWQSIHGDEPDRPRIHVIKIVSNTATASAASPQGEPLGFSISPGGRRIAAYNSARLFLLQTAALPVDVSQEFALRRRPLAVDITDDGLFVAILADPHSVNVYDLSNNRIRRVKTIKPDFPANAIALSSTGALLAAAYEGGVEIFSLDASALSTDRRAVRSPQMDRLVFSPDGSSLLGTTTRINASATLVVSVPVFPSAPDGAPTSQELKEAWCTSLLDPENIRHSSHATFCRGTVSPSHERLFAWNGLDDTFGILDTLDMQYSAVDFPVTISPPLSTCGGLGVAIHSVPAIDEHGGTVAMIVNDRTIRLYVIPHDLDDDQDKVEAHSIDHELDEEYGCPCNDLRWVHSPANFPAPSGGPSRIKGRLVVTSPGGMTGPDLTEDTMEDDVEGGRVLLFDFDPQFYGQPGQTFTLTLGKAPPQTLEEEEMDVAQEVALVRRRTMNQSRNGTFSQRVPAVGRAATTHRSKRAMQQPNARRASLVDSLQQSAGPQLSSAVASYASSQSVASMDSQATLSLPDLLETTSETSSEPGELTAIEEPYMHNLPRSGITMQRAATAANRHRYQALEERATGNSNEAMGLPQYTEEPNAPLPRRFRTLAGLDVSIPNNTPRFANGPISHSDRVVSAPPDIPENFGDRGLPRSATGSSTFSIPRSLQRAYNQGTSAIGVGPAPHLIGDWENVAPPPLRSLSSAANGTLPAPSPVSASSPQRYATFPFPTSGRSSPFSRLQEHSRNSARYSSSLASTTNGHYPAAVTSLPSSRAGPFTPAEQHNAAQPAGSVAHPVTNWYPPAAAGTSGPAGALQRGGSRASRNARDRGTQRTGWFRTKKVLQSKDGGPGRTKSGVQEQVWMAADDGRKCVVM